MLCVILRVWDRWAAVVDSKLMVVSTQKDRAITLWKAGDARMRRVPIEKFVFLTFLDHRLEMIGAEELNGRGKTYRTAMRSGAKVSEDDKDEIARAIELVRSADWAQLPPKLRAYYEASDAWSKTRAVYLRIAAATVHARATAEAFAAIAAKARREGNISTAKATKERAAKLAEKAHRLSQRADAARDAELWATAAMHEATAAHLESKLCETRELIAYRALAEVAQARATRKRALRRGKMPDAEAEAQFAQLIERAETLVQRLRDEDDASRCSRSVGPVWRVFIM